MKYVHSIEFSEGSNEERLPGFSADFPYIASCAQLDKYDDMHVPWHWHRAVEIFYIESGALRYITPEGEWIFPAGSGGFVNSNVLHSSKVMAAGGDTVQLLHIFETELISGAQSERIHEKYVRPLTNTAEIDVVALYPDDPVQGKLLEKIRTAFELDENDWGYELQLRRQLTDIWLDIFELARPAMDSGGKSRVNDDKMKAMMLYIQTHYPENISVEQIARHVHISKRVCFRFFRERLHMSPLEYITDYRLRKACRMLAESDETVTDIACACGLGSGSYFGRLFREAYGCTPKQYRKKWHDRDKN